MCPRRGCRRHGPAARRGELTQRAVEREMICDAECGQVSPDAGRHAYIADMVEEEGVRDSASTSMSAEAATGGARVSTAASAAATGA